MSMKNLLKKLVLGLLLVLPGLTAWHNARFIVTGWSSAK